MCIAKGNTKKKENDFWVCYIFTLSLLLECISMPKIFLIPLFWRFYTINTIYLLIHSLNICDAPFETFELATRSASADVLIRGQNAEVSCLISRRVLRSIRFISSSDKKRRLKQNYQPSRKDTILVKYECATLLI